MVLQSLNGSSNLPQGTRLIMNLYFFGFEFYVFSLVV